LSLDEQVVAANMKRLGIEPGPCGALATQKIKAVAEHQLGLRPVNTAVLFGMGRLGAAIASYEGFGAHGRHHGRSCQALQRSARGQPAPAAAGGGLKGRQTPRRVLSQASRKGAVARL